MSYVSATCLLVSLIWNSEKLCASYTAQRSNDEVMILFVLIIELGEDRE